MAFRPSKPDYDLGSELEFEEYAPRLRRLRPKMRADAEIIPQKFRGQNYFVLQDPVTLQFYRIAETEREVVGQFDGQSTLGEIHDRLKAKFGAEAPSFRDLARFALMLRQANLTVPEPGEEARWSVERSRKKRHDEIKQKLSSFMYITIPLVDPERFLNAFMPYLRWIYTKPFFLVWLISLAAALFGFIYNFNEFVAPAHGVLAPGNLIYLWIAFVLVKTCHEFGHGFTAKHYGAEVHRMGIMFLIFMPVWYVDATPVWAFPQKRAKVLVGASGMMAELFVASWCVWGFLALEPGVLRSVLYNVIFIASVSSLLFNGNPLLRYDAYYILADLVEIPNLRQRSTQYLQWLAKRYLVGEKVPPMPATRYERAWFAIYGVLATAYRTLVVVGIILFIASKLFFVGVAAAIVVAVLWVVVPFGKLVKYIFFERSTRPVRVRAVAVFSTGVALVALLLGGVPFAEAVRAPCALEAYEMRVLRAEWPGFLEEAHVDDGDYVEEGQLLATLRNEELGYQIRRQEMRIAGSLARLRLLETQDLAGAQAEAVRLAALHEDLETLHERRRSLEIRAPFAGRVVAPNIERVEGRFLHLGEELFAVASLDRLRVTAVVGGDEIDAIRRVGPNGVRIKFASDPGAVLIGSVERAHPAATTAVPPPALTSAAGGPVLLDPGAPRGERTLLPWNRVDVALAPGQEPPPVGVTGTARFVVGRATLGSQLWTRFRRMLHRRFLVAF